MAPSKGTGIQARSISMWGSGLRMLSRLGGVEEKVEWVTKFVRTSSVDVHIGCFAPNLTPVLRAFVILDIPELAKEVQYKEKAVVRQGPEALHPVHRRRLCVVSASPGCATASVI